MTPERRQSFSRDLLAWYDLNKRDLPWRRDRDPYRVWISEIMLQQTRVAAVVDHYRRFLRRFPTVRKLASARESSVLAAWSGLGYYRRARMLHAAAKTIVRASAAEIPRRAQDLRQLSGIGRYTAAAIASIAFGEPIAVVDGNVERVLSRISGTKLSGEKAWQAAETILDRQRPGDFNQAMMELGATVCLPQQPKCLLCPVSDACTTQGEGNKAGTETRRRRREIHYALDCRNGSVLMVRRAHDASLMPGMWELPEVPSLQAQKDCLKLRHSITVTDYAVRVHRVKASVHENGRWVPKRDLNKLPLTGLARKILAAADWLQTSN